jgi:hypothetical protein
MSGRKVCCVLINFPRHVTSIQVSPTGARSCCSYRRPRDQGHVNSWVTFPIADCDDTVTCVTWPMRPLLDHHCVRGEGHASLVTSPLCAGRGSLRPLLPHHCMQGEGHCVPCYITTVCRERDTASLVTSQLCARRGTLRPLLHHHCVQGEGHCVPCYITTVVTDRDTASLVTSPLCAQRDTASLVTSPLCARRGTLGA